MLPHLQPLLVLRAEGPPAGGPLQPRAESRDIGVAGARHVVHLADGGLAQTCKTRTHQRD